MGEICSFIRMASESLSNKVIFEDLQTYNPIIPNKSLTNSTPPGFFNVAYNGTYPRNVRIA